MAASCVVPAKGCHVEAEMVHPMLLGLALCCLGALGLVKQFLLLALCIPLAAWVSLAMLVAGALVLVTEQARKMMREDRLHLVPVEFMTRQMQDISWQVWLMQHSCQHNLA
eukprot:gb/GFBE01043847.1/.p1 GENE.gb/GFBE01043847.1/~~gb/GFBE01043847.1/.p1  ORF type:complete len:111 (+),score=21.44 gb/GFBE01043847.1/:1-333(+)